MSYEGYEEHICKNGHRFILNDIYNISEDEKIICPHCEEISAFFNGVDCTNEPNQGAISEEGWKTLLLEEEISEICNLGHKHITKQAVYRIPSNHEILFELPKFRMYSSELQPNQGDGDEAIEYCKVHGKDYNEPCVECKALSKM